LPVNVYRSDMILAHRRYAAQLNVSDTFTRLLYSIVQTGLAPESFYQPAAGGGRARAHYDGLPVDFTAAVMTRMGDHRDGGYRTVNVVNPHDDGRSLDTFVDWIEAAGYPVHRIAAYDEWLQRFEGALRALPEAARTRSSLAILESLRRPRPGRPGQPPSAQFQAALHELDDLQVPHLDEPYIRKCLQDLRTLGFIPPPPAAR
jgi:fatty acid CoA ligase FadD9